MLMSKAIQKKKQEDGWKLLPLQFILAVLPLLLGLHQGNSGYGVYAWNSTNDFYLDVFLHTKMVWFLITSAVMVGLIGYKLYQAKVKSKKIAWQKWLPLFVYAGAVVVSSICSNHPSYSLKGAMDAWEPVWVLLGYVVTAFYAYLVIETQEDVRRLIDAAVIGGGCMAFVGVLQALGMDPLTTETIQRIFAGNEFVDRNGLLRLTFPKGMAYGTLYNPNYVGTYVAMYLPLLVLGVILYKQIWKKAVCGVIALGLLVTLFASQSRTGLFAVAAVGIVAAFFAGRVILKRWYVVFPVLLLAIVSFWMVDRQREYVLTERLLEIFTVKPGEEPVLGVDTTGNGVRVVCKDKEYIVSMPVSGEEFGYTVFENGEQREVRYTHGGAYAYAVLADGTELEIQTAKYEEDYAFGLHINDRMFYFTNRVENGNYLYINELGKTDECIIPENVFPGYEAVASGRGYVFGRTIPLLKKYLFIGAGPDTFALEFPQNDYVARYKSGFENIIFTRPHNLYLQMGIQTGVLSLLAFLTFYIMYFAGSCKRYCFCQMDKQEKWLGVALFLSTVGFMAAGLANDSLIVVTPVFYVLLGTGIAVNDKIIGKKQKGLE